MRIKMTVNDKSGGLCEVTQLTGTRVDENFISHEDTAGYVCEHMMEIYVNEKKAATLVCTPSNLAYLVLGRLLTEGIISGIQDIESLYICDSGNVAKVFMQNEPALKAADVVEPTCCTGNRTLLQNIDIDWLKPLQKVEIIPENVFRLAKEFAAGSKIHGRTSGTHSCYLQYDGKTVFSCEDIGRHNALDKCIGYMLEKELEPLRCILFTTGRVPTDMVKKAVAAGVGTLVSKAVPTDAAVEMAEKYNLNLICKAWPDSYVVYA
jgi:FdhD protein